MDEPEQTEEVTPAIEPNVDIRPKYRVFISYSHEDKALVEGIAAILSRNGLQPMWDRNFAYGQGFHEQIKNFIAHAHVFLPVLTRTADARKWVHQEIGYAMALHIPVLPVAVEGLPGEMIQQIHALRMDGDDPEVLSDHLSKDVMEALVERHARNYKALYECAELPEDRAKMMSAYADDVFALGIRDVVRQKGALSSFHIPREVVGNPIWRRRYGLTTRSEEHCRLQRQERLSLQRHAQTAGCKLIVKPGLLYERYGPDARISRLESLVKFLEEMDDARCRVAIQEEMDARLSVTILGNWFSAESLAGEGGRGYRQTVFTRHAPTVMEKLDVFDAEFDELLSAVKVKPEESRRWAIGVLEQTIQEAKSDMKSAQ
ncbi:MAG: TIR domain-containing protein [Candidatus Hydrogenedentes bacterium]|nr:TIR domain-containing protein [Candidatus Hydrogenedentota bacterium]